MTHRLNQVAERAGIGLYDLKSSQQPYYTRIKPDYLQLSAPGL